MIFGIYTLDLVKLPKEINLASLILILGIISFFFKSLMYISWILFKIAKFIKSLLIMLNLFPLVILLNWFDIRNIHTRFSKITEGN